MQRKTLLIFFLLVGIVNIFADGGCCIKYEVKITLKNDSIISGYFYSLCLDMDIDSQSFGNVLKSEKMLDYIDSPDSIEIYKEVISLFKPVFYGSKILTAYKKDRIKISLSDIKLFQQIDKCGCHSEIVNDFKYISNSLYPIVITEFTDEEIDRMVKDEPLDFFYYDNFSCLGLSYIWVISYNKSYSKSDITALIKEKVCNDDILKYNDNSLSDTPYLLLKGELRTKNIFLFKTNYEN